jgi:uncharacterized protein YciI
MKNLISVVFLTLLNGILLPCQAQNDLNNFKWLEGAWEVKSATPTEGERVIEEWYSLNENTMIGKSYTIYQRYSDVPADTQVSEAVVLMADEEGIYYSPTVYGQNENKPVPFKLVSDYNNSFVFENKEHDFPTQIIYNPTSSTSFSSTIGGLISEQEISQTSEYVRIYGEKVPPPTPKTKPDENAPTATVVEPAVIENPIVTPSAEEIAAVEAEALPPLEEPKLKQYYFVMLVKGPVRDQSEKMVRKIQIGHLENIKRLTDLGKIKLAGPFMDDDDWRGIFIMDCTTLEEVQSLLKTDPAITSGRLTYIAHPWGAEDGALR